MNRDIRRGNRLVVLCAVGLLLFATTAALYAAGDGTASISPPSSHTGLTPFISPGGSIAQACDDVDTCTTGAITNVDAGDTLIVIVTEYTTSASHPSLVEEVTTGGDVDLTFLADTPCITGSGHGVTSIYGLADVTAQASVTFTADYAADEYYTIHVLDVEGTAAAPFETAGTGVCSAEAGTTGTATVTTTVANDLVILGVEVRASTAIAATGGDTLVTDAVTTGAELDSGAMLDEIDAGTGAISLSGTFTSASWSAVAIALKPLATSPLESGTVSPSTATLDAGQSVELTSTAATGGTAPISYQWYSASSASTCSSGTPISGATGQAYSTPALAVGTFYYCIWATDSSTPTPQVVYSNVATITAVPALTVAVTPPAPTIDDGQWINLTANVSGGVGSDTYAWYAGSTCTGTILATTEVLTTSALTANATYCVVVTDSSYSPYSVMANDTVTVSLASLSVSITPAAPDIDSGQNVELTALPAGGVGPYTYAWYAGSTCSGTVLGVSQEYLTSTLTASTTFCVRVTDNTTIPAAATAIASVTVSGAPLSVTITPNAPAIDSGQWENLTADPSGGTGADTYLWFQGGTCSGTVLATTQVLTTAALTATTEYCVQATDSSSIPASAQATDTITVSALPLSVAIVPSAPTIDYGQSIPLVATPSGGTGSDTFAWYSGLSCTGPVLATSPIYTTPSLTADSPYCVTATDSSSLPATASANATVTVSSSPLSVSITPVAPSIDSGESIQLTALPSGGVGADTFAWYEGAVCTGSVLGAAAAYTTPALTETTTYCVGVTDGSSVPDIATANDTVTVSGAALTVAITPAAPTIDSGQTVVLTANPSGGTGADTFAWHSGTACTNAVLATTQAYTTPVLTASTSYCVAVTDSASVPDVATATAAVTVSSAALSVSINPAAPSIDLGQSVQLTANPSGGTGADSFAWYAGDACSGSVLATTQVYTTPTLTSNSNYCVQATDSAYTPVTATATAAVTVSSAALSVTITPKAPTIDSGQTVELTAVPLGGTGAYSYAWYAGSSCTGSVLATSKVYTSPALSDNTSYCVAVTDSAVVPATATATAAVAVASPTTPTTSPPSWEYPLIGGLAALIVAALLFALIARRRKNVFFTQTGLPPGTEWSVTLAGVEQRSHGETISYRRPKGTHAYTVGAVVGYAGNPKSGTVDVGKTKVDVAVTFAGDH